MTFTDHTTTLDLVKNWPYRFQQIESGDPLYDYLGVYATELSRVDAFIDELYEQRYVNTATGIELDKLGAAVGVSRDANETEEHYRFRVKLGKTVSASNGTAHDIEAILTQAFGDDALEGIDVSYDGSDPIVVFNIPSETLDNSPASASLIEDELERAFPCGYGVRIVTSDSFLFGESGDQGLGNGELI